MTEKFISEAWLRLDWDALQVKWPVKVPAEFDQEFLERVQELTVEQAQEAIRELLLQRIFSA